MEFKKSFLNKIMIMLGGVILSMFFLGWILPIGIDKVSSLSYRDYLFSTYTVFTQFGFLMFSFLVAFFVTKEYTNKTILFYKCLSYNSLKFYLNKVFVLITESICFIILYLIIVCILFHDFSMFFQMLYLFSCVVIQYVLIVSFISLLTPNVLIAIGISVFYWILSVVLVSVGGIFKYLAFFDASNDFYEHVNILLQGNSAFLSINDNLSILIFTIIWFIIGILVSKFANNRWLKLGIN